MNRHQIGLFLKALSPRTVAKVMGTFDRATAMIVGICWFGAAVMVGFAVYTVNLTVSAKHATEAAMVQEPVLPSIVRKRVAAKEVQVFLDRLQRRYPDIKFVFRGNLDISSSSGAQFHDWLASLDYLDTVSPKYRWSLQELCVGKCSGRELMQATLIGENIAFEKPRPDGAQ